MQRAAWLPRLALFALCCCAAPAAAQTPTPTPFITITVPQSCQTFQRHGTLGTIVLSGTCGGGTTIEARFNTAGAYQSVGTCSGGVWSGLLVSRPQGQGMLQVRYVANPSVAASQTYVGIGDVIPIIGDSNSVGAGTHLQFYSHPTLRACLYGTNPDVWRELVDPWANGAGSFVPLLATRIMAQTNVPVAFVPCGVSGTQSAGWLRNNANHTDPTTRYGACLTRTYQMGLVTPLVLTWVSILGANDAIAQVSQAAFGLRITQIADSVYEDLGVPLTVFDVGMVAAANAATPTPAVDNIRQAIRDAWNTAAHVKVGGTAYQQLFTVDASGFAVHYHTDADLQAVADALFSALNAAFWGGLDGRGPMLAAVTCAPDRLSCTVRSTDTTLPLLPVTYWPNTTAWKVAGTSVTSAICSASNLTSIFFNAPATVPITVSYAAANTGSGNTTLTDSSTYTLRADPFLNIAAPTETVSPFTPTPTNTPCAGGPTPGSGFSCQPLCPTATPG